MKARISKWWNECNEEGVRGKDAVLIPIIGISMFLILANLMLWMARPEQEWIGHILFPCK